MLRTQERQKISVATHDLRFILDSFGNRTLVDDPALSNDRKCQLNRRLVKDDKVYGLPFQRQRKEVFKLCKDV